MLALPGCLLPSFDDQYLSRLWVLMDNRFTIVVPHLPLLSAGVRTIPKTPSWVESVKLCCLAFASPTHFLASDERSPFHHHGCSGALMFGGEPRAEGRGDPRVHQQNQHLLPSLYRLGFELALASENKILGEFCCKTPINFDRTCPPFFSDLETHPSLSISS